MARSTITVAAYCGSIFFWLAVVFSSTECAVPKDEVLSLPGWSGALPSKQYSGYLSPTTSIAATKMFHYWFVESTNDPQSDPVVLWLNGGPGCSSLDGYFSELGPLHFNTTSADSQDIPSLIRNPYAWTNIANVIFLESPAGVGFSYSTNPVVDYRIDDNQTALDNYGVLVSFFRAYPEYKKNDFYIAGESYAGIYVPTLVNTIMQMNEKVVIPENFINLKGFMVGNGCIGNKVGSCGHEVGLKIHMEFYHNHALISEVLYSRMMQECRDFTNMSESCADLVNEASKGIGNVDIYDIYQPCINTLPPGYDETPRERNFLKELYVSRNPGPYHGPDECIDDRVQSKYFDNPTIREAIHVAPISVTGNWRVCTSKIHYIANTDSLLPIYPTLIKTYRALIFNGDVDGCVPYIGDEMWTSGLNFPVKEGWRPWSLDNQVAGYITQYDWNDFKFVTVKGAGHMVPMFKPKQAFAMFEKFIKNTPF